MINLLHSFRTRWFVFTWKYLFFWILTCVFTPFKRPQGKPSRLLRRPLSRRDKLTLERMKCPWNTPLPRYLLVALIRYSFHCIHLPTVILMERIDRICDGDVLSCNDPLSRGTPMRSGRSRSRRWERSAPDLWGSGRSSIHKCSHKGAHTLGTNSTHRYGFLQSCKFDSRTLSDLVHFFLKKPCPTCAREMILMLGTGFRRVP